MYAIIRSEQGQDSIGVSDACRCLEVSRSAYLEWMKARPKLEDPFEMKLRGVIQEIAAEFPSYGYRPMTHELRHCGMTVGYKRIRRPYDGPKPAYSETQIQNLHNRQQPQPQSLP